MIRTELAEAIFDSREVIDHDFPTGGSAADKLRFLIKYAVLAPSSHNSQPWLFKVEDDAVELYADRTRALPVVDPEDRELIISCGAAFMHLCLAIRAFGYEDEVAILPEPNNPDLLARVKLGTRWASTEEERRLLHSMLSRRTNRMPFFKRNVPDEAITRLRRAAEQQGLWSLPIDGDANRRNISALIAEADHMQWSNKTFRRELAAWVNPNRALRGDGIPGYAMGYKDLMSMAGPVVIRTFDLGNGRAARDIELAEGSPLILVLGTPKDTPKDWFKTGEALAKVLLVATDEGLSGSFLNQPVEIPHMRKLLGKMLNQSGYPQMVLRLGYGPEVPLTPRRPVHEVLI